MIDVSFDDATAATPGLRALVRRLIRQEWPYLLMLLLVLLGVGYTGFAEAPIRGYWVLLTPVSAAICIATVWPELTERHERWRAIRTQALHWGAVLIAMELVFLTEATRMMTAEASALSVLTLLALGTFIAGIHLPSWRIALVGLLLAIAVPCIVLLERWAMFVLLLGAVAAAVIVPVWWTYFRKPPLDEAEPLSAAPPQAAPRAAPSVVPAIEPNIEPSVQPSIVPNAGPSAGPGVVTATPGVAAPPQNPRAGHTPDGGADQNAAHNAARTAQR
ncbi:hypothetical protein NP284_10735 [Rhodopseudomonas pseudopalustris]|uniref:hypothetical protein n=1 Tax=Rhodopseudomonas pseudopalustris TaxID=1513892 RepID=UPI003F975B6D